MYHTPMLERYGTLRELTADEAKRPDVDDLASVFGQGDNDGCNLDSESGSSAGCAS